MATPMEPVRRGRLADQVYARLRHLISTGELAEGQQLREDALAKSLRVSTTPIREALQRLAGDQLIDTRLGYSAVVKSMDPKEALDFVTAYRAIAGCAFALGYERLTVDDHAEIAARVAQYHQYLDAERWEDAFQLTILVNERVYSASDNAELVRLLDSMRPRLERLARMRYPDINRSATQQRQLDLLGSGPADAAIAGADAVWAELAAHMASETGDTSPASASGLAGEATA